MEKKILIMTLSSIKNGTSNGRTLISLFSKWQKSQLSHIYFRGEKENENYVAEYLCLSNISKIAFLKKMLPDKIYRKIENSGIINELLWLFADKKKIVRWVEKKKPDAIFLVINGFVFPNKLAHLISAHMKIPCLVYFVDDWVLLKPRGIFRRLTEKVYIRNVSALVERAPFIVVIGDKMKRIYQSLFCKPCFVFMNSIDLSATSSGEINHNTKDSIVLKMSYFGSLHLGRWRTLVQIADAAQLYGKCKISIFTGSRLEAEFMQYIERNKDVIDIAGFIPGEKVQQHINDSDVLIFVESFAADNIDSIRYSVSTKIPEYFLSRKPVLAVGPSDSASIEYLAENEAACVICDENNIIQRVNQFLDDRTLWKKYISNGEKLLFANHDVCLNAKNIVREIGKSINVNERKI